MAIAVKKNQQGPPTDLVEEEIGPFGVPKEAYDIGILNLEFHERLLMDLSHVTATAGIPREFVWSRMSRYCSPEEFTWVKKLRSNKDRGLVYSGDVEVAIESKMMAITGACLRNYIDARVMPVQTVLSNLKKESMPAPTVLLIPNFFLAKGSGGDLPSWQVSSLLGLLYSRLAAELKTVLYVSSLTDLGTVYGESFRTHLQTHYKIISGT